MSDDWIKIFGAVLGSGIIFMVTKWEAVVHLLKFKERRMANNLSSLAAGLRILEHQVDDPASGVDRAILFEGHNGGGKPRIGKPYHIDVIHPEIIESDPTAMRLSQKELLERYSNLQPTSDYLDMLRDLLLGPHDKIFIVSEMSPGMLKSIYDKEGVTSSMVSFVAVEGESLYYMSQSTFNGNFTDGQIITAQLRANQMRNLFKRTYR